MLYNCMAYHQGSAQTMVGKTLLCRNICCSILFVAQDVEALSLAGVFITSVLNTSGISVFYYLFYNLKDCGLLCPSDKVDLFRYIMPFCHAPMPIWNYFGKCTVITDLELRVTILRCSCGCKECSQLVMKRLHQEFMNLKS